LAAADGEHVGAVGPRHRQGETRAVDDVFFF
jgi:hypothetical protein